MQREISITRTKQTFPAGILMGCLLFQGAFVGILLNGTGITISAIILDKGFPAASLSPYYTIKMLVGAAGITAMTKLFFRWGARKYLTVMTVTSCLCFGIMALFTQPWQWYIDAAATGIFSANAMMVIPCIINNWFRKNNGMITGLVMAASGLAGALFNPVYSQWIDTMGWQRTAVLVSGLVGVLCLTASLFLLELKPSDRGCQAYGETEIEAEQKAEREPAFRDVSSGKMLVLCVGVLLAGTVLVQLTNYIPLFAASVGFSLQTGALMTSFIMVGNVAGKFLAGFLCDRIGPWKTGAGMLTAVAAALAVLMAEPTSPAVLYGASVVFGLVYSASVVVPPLACLDAFGSGTYAGLLSRITAVNSVLGAGCNFLIAGIYDRTGSFRNVFLMGLVLWAVSLVSTGIVLALRKKALHGKKMHMPD